MTAIAATAAAFQARHGVPPSVVCSAPGRVNLIGEHTDYSVLPVLPMAIQRRVVVAAAPLGHGVLADSLAHPAPLELVAGTDPMAVHGWHRYLAAAVGQAGAEGGTAGIALLIGGDLPSTGGLSSSSALTVALLAALGAVRGGPLTGADLVGAAVRAERSVGVEGGTMDQTVAVYARAGHALRIDFDPPGRRAVPIPGHLAFVAASSGDMAPKGTMARDAYNLRVVACRAAAALLAAALDVDAGDPPLLGRVAHRAGVMDAIADLPEELTAAEAAARSKVELHSVVGLSAESFDPTRPLAVRECARHVLTEAGRVDRAEAALAAGDIRQLGRLFDQSHQSLARFGATTPALDAVVAAMRSAGAAGARLTGAGFGGYAVGVCRPELADRVVDAARQATGGPAFPVQPAEGVR